MKNDDIHPHLPPPPLFTLRPPPKPPGEIFEEFVHLQLLNGQCLRRSLNILSSPTNQQEELNWLNLFLLLLAIISVLSCFIIIICIFICLKKLKKEEKQYETYVMTGSLSSTNPPRRIHENSQCPSKFDDYYSHQLIPLSEPTCSVVQSPCEISLRNSSPNHQYECIPEYLLTMKHQHRCQQFHQSSYPYATFSRVQRVPRTNSNHCTCSELHPEESSTPLISNDQSQINLDRSKSMIIGWTKQESSSSSQQQQRQSFLSQLRKSSLFK